VLDALAAAYQDTYALATVVVVPVLALVWLLRPTTGLGAKRGVQASPAAPAPAPRMAAGG
jgi:hypothetical protein